MNGVPEQFTQLGVSEEQACDDQRLSESRFAFAFNKDQLGPNQNRPTISIW
ncbi:hypothetical protein BH10BDE1_BH10BDE1_24080 [soil metagenome]